MSFHRPTTTAPLISETPVQVQLADTKQIFFFFIERFLQALDTKTTQLNEKQISVPVLHLFFHPLTVV